MELGTGNVKNKLTELRSAHQRVKSFITICSIFSEKYTDFAQISTFSLNTHFFLKYTFKASAKTEGNTSSPPAPDYATSGLTHTGLLSREAPATSPNTIQTNSTMLAASSTTATAPTDTTPSAAAHMPSYGGALAASSSAYGLGGPYSAYPYANLVS